MWNMPDGDHWMGWWWMPFHGLSFLLFLVIVIASVVALFRFIRGDGGRGKSRASALEALDERYARGEIKREEYLEKKRDLGG